MNDIKLTVKKAYGNIAKNVTDKPASSCSCGPSSCCGDASQKDYDLEMLKDLPQEAINASLGCANPLVFAELKAGETVLDLGSGGGIDVFLASRFIGEKGKVYGLDMTDEMLELANKNKAKAGIQNVEFIKGYIEEIPLADKTVDVIMSNCVINLTEDKEAALSEAFRVLKEGGRLAIADIVALRKDIPANVKKDMELWAGCFAGALAVEEYKAILEKVGFTKVSVEPAHVYSKEVVKEMMKDFSADGNFDLDSIDNAFAGAYIKAYK